VATWAGPTRAGLQPATGGDGKDACSADMLLQALLACTGVILRSVAIALGVDIRSARLRAQGHFDARGTLGVSREAPVGAQDIAVEVELDTDADDDVLARLAAMTDRYCVVAHSLAQRPTLTIRRAQRARAGQPRLCLFSHHPADRSCPPHRKVRDHGGWHRLDIPDPDQPHTDES
jgi:uncharacterized OsmC-like protein